MLVPILVLSGLVLLYIGSYTLNKKTPVPAECKLVADAAKCGSCNNFACGLRE